MAGLPVHDAGASWTTGRAACEQRPAGFAADERGVVAVIFAITFCAVFLTVAVAIDYARTATEIPARAERGRLRGACRLASAGTAGPGHARPGGRQRLLQGQHRQAQTCRRARQRGARRRQGRGAGKGARQHADEPAQGRRHQADRLQQPGDGEEGQGHRRGGPGARQLGLDGRPADRRPAHRGAEPRQRRSSPATRAPTR